MKYPRDIYSCRFSGGGGALDKNKKKTGKNLGVGERGKGEKEKNEERKREKIGKKRQKGSLI